MWDGMAEMSFMHLKPNDFIYVSGQLGCYTKPDKNGELRMRYKVQILLKQLLSTLSMCAFFFFVFIEVYITYKKKCLLSSL